MTLTRARTGTRWRPVVAPVLAAFALIVGSRSLPPAGAGFLGIPVFLATLLASMVAFAFSGSQARDAGPSWRSLVPLVLFGSFASGLYWQHVWSYRHYEMEGIPLVLFYLLGFWWPGVFVAVASRFLELGIERMASRTWAGRLAVGALAGALGAGGYEVADDLYYRSRDRVPFGEAAGPISPPWPGIEPGTLAVRHDERRLVVRGRMDPGAVESVYELFDSVETYLTHLRGLLRRMDTDEVIVEVEAPAGTFLAFRAADPDTARPIRELYRLDRSGLPEQGRLRSVDVERMTWIPSHELQGEGRHETFERLFRTAVVGDTLAIAFGPIAPPERENADLHAAAWATANRVVRETARFFPETRRFRLDLPSLDTLLERDAVRAEAFRLQHSLRDRDSLLGLRVADREGVAGTLDPATFFPSGEPIDAAQVAVLRITGPLEEHVAGLLFEGILVGTGRIHVTDVDPAGRIELLYATWEGTLHGPARMAPGESAWLGDVRVDHLGAFPRLAFRPEGRVPGDR